MISFDTGFCDVHENGPTPKNDIDTKMHFSIKGQNPWTNSDETISFTVKDWMEGLKGTENEKLKEANQLLSKHGKKQRRDNEPLDLMSFHDKWIDGQIGGLGSVQEHVHENPKQLVPLFEFRDLGSVDYKDFKSIVEKAEKAVLDLHKKHSGQ